MFKTVISCTSASMFNRFTLLFLAFGGWSLVGCSTDQTSRGIAKPFNPVVLDSIMHNQQLAWNRGDLEGFMDAYWRSDSLVFVGKNGAKFGWQTTLDNYKRGYPNREAMGTLQFTNEIIEPTGENSAFVMGKWELFRTSDTLSGYYSLVWKRINNQWFIRADHSS